MIYRILKCVTSMPEVGVQHLIVGWRPSAMR
jgi:hypothetical protein